MKSLIKHTTVSMYETQNDSLKISFRWNKIQLHTCFMITIINLQSAEYPE